MTTEAGTVDGGAGDDILIIGAGVTSAIGGTGYDRLYAYQATSGVTFNDLGGNGIELAYGSSHNDVFNGSSSSVAMKMFGSNGNDILTGGSTGDLMFGGNDNDTLRGNGGDDYMFGGAGSDIADYTGTNSTDYTVLNIGAGNWTVIHNATGDTDQLFEIETLDFDDMDIV